MRRVLLLFLLLLPVTVHAQTSVIVRGKVSAVNATTTPLAGNATFTGGFELARDYTTLTVSVFSDKASAAGGLEIQWSSDAVNVDVVETHSVTANVGDSWTTVARGIFYRVVYTNGATTQTAFRLSAVLRQSGAPGYTESASAGLTDAELRATPVPVSGTVTANVGTGTQPVSGTVTVTDGAGALNVIVDSGTTAATQSGTWTVQPGNTANTVAWKVDGSAVTQPVSGTFWQATQPVSGTVTVNAIPAGNNNIGDVDVVTLPANASVNLSQVAGATVATGNGTQAGTQRVTVAQGLTYSASNTAMTATAAGTGVFFNICGSASKTVRIQQLIVSGTVATGAKYGDVILKKTSAATTAGTATTLTNVPLDSNNAAATATVKYYTVLGTPGTPVGAIQSQVLFLPITATPAMTQPIEFKWRDQDSQSPVLRGTAQCVEANFGTTTTTAPTLLVSVKWTEE